MSRVKRYTCADYILLIMPVNPEVLRALINKFGKAAVQAAMTKVQVPNMTGTATAAATGLRDIPKTESTVGKEAAVAAAALAAPYVAAEAGPALAKGIEWVGEKAMPSALLDNIGLSAVSPYADAAALSYWSGKAGKAAIEAGKEGRAGEAAGMGMLAALPAVMPLVAPVSKAISTRSAANKLLKQHNVERQLARENLTLPDAPPEINNPATGYAAPVGASASPHVVELRTPSGRLVEPDMDISGMSYDDLVGTLNGIRGHTESWLEDAGIDYRAATTLTKRIQHALDHNGEDLFSAWGKMSAEDVYADAHRMYPGYADDLLEDYGRVSGRMQELFDEVEYAGANDVIGLDTDEILQSYFARLQDRFDAYTSGVGSSSKAYLVSESPLTQFEKAKLSGIAKVLNRKIGSKAGVDFTRIDTVEDVAKIQKALRDNDLVPLDMEMPLDIAHMSYFSGNTEAMSDAGRRAMRTVDEQLPGTANLVDDTSTASTPMRPGIAAKRYGDTSGKVTVKFIEDQNDPSGYRYMTTNDYDHGFDVYIDMQGNVSFGNKLPAAVTQYVDPNIDLSSYRFTPDEVSKLYSGDPRTLYPDIFQRYLDLTETAQKAAIGPMLKYQGALETAIQKSGIPGTSDFVVPKARIPDSSHRRFSPAFQPWYEFPWMGIYRHNLGGYLKKFEGGGYTDSIEPARVTAKRPVDVSDFSPESQRTIADYALAVKQGTIDFNSVPEKYRTAVYQTMITNSTNKAADVIAKTGLNTALLLTDPVGYAAGWGAQKALAYGNDAASGRNEYDASDILGYTPIRGTEYAAEHPVASTLTDIVAGAIGGGVVRNIGNVASNAEHAAQNAAAVSGMERNVLSYPRVSQTKTFGTVYKSGTKGSGKTGTVRTAQGRSGYAANSSPKGVFSNQSSGTPSVITWSSPDAAIPISPVPFNPAVPSILWGNMPDPRTVLVQQEQPEVQVERGPVRTSYGNSITPQEALANMRRFDVGGPVGEGDPDFVGPPTPLSVKIANSTYQEYDDMAQKYDGKYPNIAYFLRGSGKMRGQRLGANEAMIMDWAPENLMRISGTEKHNVPVTRAALDSMALNGAKAGVSPEVALGIPAQETNFGFYPTAAWVGDEMRSFAQEAPNGYAAGRWQVTPVELLNDAAYANDPYGSTISYVAKKLGVGVPWDDASYMMRNDLWIILKINIKFNNFYEMNFYIKFIFKNK